MKIRFLLKRRGKKNGTHPIYLALYDRDITELIYTGSRITTKEWSKEDRLPKDHSSQVYTAINEKKKAVEKVMLKMIANDVVVTPFQLKQEYEKRTKQKLSNQDVADKKEKNSLTKITTLINKWINEGMDSYLPSTKKTIVISINQFKEYLKGKSMLSITIKDLTPDIIQDYSVQYLQNKRKLVDSTHGKRMKHLRLFLKWGKIDDAVIKDIKIRSVKPSEGNIIALTQAELNALEATDVSYSKEMQKAKDMFLLACYTGLRVSDLKRINPHRVENNRINITLQKNRKSVSIPIIPETRAILERYDWFAPKVSDQQVNESIKLVCEKAKINKVTLERKKKNGLVVESWVPKHKLISSHVGGKTFITLAPDRWGLTVPDVAAIVGKDIKTVQGYYLKPDQESAIRKVEEQENRKLMAIK
jgi:integrase